MTGEPISMQEWLQHAAPRSPLHALRDEARKLVEDAVRFEDLLRDVRADYEEWTASHEYAHDEREGWKWEDGA